MTLRFGFMEDRTSPELSRWRNSIWIGSPSSCPGAPLQPSSQSGLPLWQDHIFITLARSASDVSDHFCIPEDRAVEVGARITI